MTEINHKKERCARNPSKKEEEDTGLQKQKKRKKAEKSNLEFDCAVEIGWPVPARKRMNVVIALYQTTFSQITK